MLLLVIILLFGPLRVRGQSVVTTYNLSFDGIFSAPTSTTTPSYVANDISADILQSLNALKENDAVHKTQNQDRHCHQMPNSSRCSVEYVDSDTHLYLSALSSHTDGSVRIDVTLAAVHAREVLVQAISNMSERLGMQQSESVWSIRRRPSAADMKKRLSDSNSVTAAQAQRELEAASLERMILDNAEMRNRTRIAKDSSLEVWQYTDVDFVEPVRTLFRDGVLQTTTAPANAAHAEALVHPALIAHLEPITVLVVSKTPSAIVREVLKHSSVHHVSVVGADESAMALIETHMPSLTDCSFLGNSNSNCLQQAQVNIIDQDFGEWINASVALFETKGDEYDWYDVVLVDVPIGTAEWLSPDLYYELDSLIESYEAIVVVSSGSQPSLFEIDTEGELSGRETFLRQAARPKSSGGLEFAVIHVYDEPLAQPMPSTFIALFYERSRKSYARFIRNNYPMIDNDMVARLVPNAHTKVYDGPTHTSYMTPSRAWENHYCKTIPGRNLPICQSFLHDWMDASFHHHGIGVRKDKVKGRTVYALEDIPKGHFVNPQDAAWSWRIEQDQWEALNAFVDEYPEAEMYRQLRDFILAYGFEQQSLGIYGWGVSIACTSTFTNHACSKAEINVGWLKPSYETEDGFDGNGVAYSPPYFRRAQVLAQLAVADKDIKEGDEILQDYTSFRVTPSKEFKKFLKTMCDDGVGLVVDHGDEL